MPRYYAWFKGGGGCDYTIACNEKLVQLNATTEEEAWKEAKETWLYLGGDHQIEEGILLEAGRGWAIPVDEWSEPNEKELKELERQEMEDLLQKTEAEAAALREKLGKS